MTAGRTNHSKFAAGTAFVCKEKDIECGHAPERWCPTCPRREGVHIVQAPRDPGAGSRVLGALRGYTQDASRAVRWKGET